MQLVAGLKWSRVRNTVLKRALYALLRPQAPKVQWRRVVCNNMASPRSIFITWLALLNRLYTKDRMILWHFPTCVLCQKENENVQHLFFQCDFARAVWQGVLRQLHICRRPQSLDDEVKWVAQRRRRTDRRSRLIVMCFSEVIHAVWLQRNAHVFGGQVS